MDFSEKQRTFREERTDLNNYKKNLRHHRQQIGLILDRIYDPQNIGALFRLADAARLMEILTYKMEVPLINKKIKRIARATDEVVTYQQFEELEDLMKHTQNKQIIALEWTNKSISYHEFKPKYPCYLIVGNEKAGLKQELLDWAEQSIHIPMHGLNTSMNAAMATAIAIYHLIDN